MSLWSSRSPRPNPQFSLPLPLTLAARNHAGVFQHSLPSIIRRSYLPARPCTPIARPPFRTFLKYHHSLAISTIEQSMVPPAPSVLEPYARLLLGIVSRLALRPTDSFCDNPSPTLHLQASESDHTLQLTWSFDFDAPQRTVRCSSDCRRGRKPFL